MKLDSLAVDLVALLLILQIMAPAVDVMAHSVPFRNMMLLVPAKQAILMKL